MAAAIVVGGCAGEKDETVSVRRPVLSTVEVSGPDALSEAAPLASPPSSAAVDSGSYPRAAGNVAKSDPGSTPPPLPSPTVSAGSRRPIPPGTYRYTTLGSLSTGLALTALPTSTFLTAEGIGTGGRQHTVRDMRDPSGSGSVTETTFEYRPDGVFLVDLQMASMFAGLGDSRRLQPPAPVPFLPTGSGPGYSRRFDLDAVAPGNRPAGVASVSIEALARESVVLGNGDTVGALVIKVVVALPPGDVTGNQEIMVWLEDGTGLYLKERAVGEGVAAGGLFRLKSEYLATLDRRLG